jgi:type IV pilus assembly protein PilZ
MKTSGQKKALDYVEGGGTERRRADRVDLVVRVDYKTVDELFSEFARNINEGGIFVETERPADLGSSITLQFRMPGNDEPIQALGRVARVSDGSHEDPPGMGIEFEHLDADARSRIDDLVRSLRVGTRS